MIRKVSLIGTGAIGASFASRLHEMDSACLSIIVDEARRDRYERNGFVINGKHVDFNFVLPTDKVDPADLILVAVKYHDLDQAIESMKNHVGPNTIILPLLNGISSEEIIGKVYGMDRLLYAICVAIDALRIENQVTYTNIGKIFFGEANNSVYSEKVEAVKAFFERMEIPYLIPENMLRSLWWKFMVNVGINQISAIMGAPYRIFQEVKEAQELMESTMREVIVLSKKIGINLEEEDIGEFYKALETLSPEGKTSMHQDVEAKRKTEVEMLAGTVCDLGKKYGVDTPINEALFKMLRTMEQMYRS